MASVPKEAAEITMSRMPVSRLILSLFVEIPGTITKPPPVTAAGDTRPVFHVQIIQGFASIDLTGGTGYSSVVPVTGAEGESPSGKDETLRSKDYMSDNLWRDRNNKGTEGENPWKTGISQVKGQRGNV